MESKAKRNFKKRFESRISLIYLKTPLKPAEQRIQKEKISTAFLTVLTGILKKEPTQNELFGIEEIKIKKI